MILPIFTRIASIVLYPFMAVYLHNSKRVRVVVLCNKKILLVRSHFGRQSWCLPGGGVERGENPMSAAVRELYEEVGIKVQESDLVCIGQLRLPEKNTWPRYDATFYKINLREQLSPNVKQWYEIIEAQWFDIDCLPAKIGDSTKAALRLANFNK
ncbi:NUDIX hydrolase [Candidatus Nomurabacteria bacterium]|nr:NUDIX hydrolase [Candidatus Saccharibacteria bacterium]MCB9821973.1 NUDIX hydrolase [Candidatus Nomurabacteria bacterium]